MAAPRPTAAEPLLAVDFGSAELKVVEAQPSPEGIRLSALARRSLHGLDLASPAACGALLKEVCAASGMTARRALFVAGAGTVAIFHREFPKMPPEALEKTCRNELKKEIKYPVEEAVLAVRVLKELDARGDDGAMQKRQRVMFAAFEAAQLRRIEAVCKESGLAAAGVLSASLSLPPLARRLRLLDGLAGEEVVLFLDFGQQQLTADFVSESGLRFSKSIAMGGAALTEVVRAMGPRAPLPHAEAEALKFRVGIKGQEEIARLDPEDADANLHKVLQVSFRKIFQRVRLSTGYFFANYKDSTLSTQFMKRIAGYGGNFEVPGVTRQFEEAYDAAVVKVDPFPAVDATACDPEIARPYALSFAPCVAALVAQFEAPEERIDFLALDAERRRPKSGMSVAIERLVARVPVHQRLAGIGFPRALAGLVALWLVAALGVLLHFGHAAWSIAADRAAVQARADELESPESRARRREANDGYELLRRKLDARSALAYPRHEFDKLLLAVCNGAPAEVSLESAAFVAGPPAALAVAGSTAVYDRMLRFNETLAKIPGVAKVVVRRSEQIDDRIFFRFELELKRDGEAAR